MSNESVLTAIPEDPYTRHHEEESLCSTSSTQKSSEIENIVDVILDTSSTKVSALPVVETFLLSAIILTSFGMSEMLGNLMADTVNAYFSTLGAVFTAVIAIPVTTSFFLMENGSFVLLLLSGWSQGLLIGAAISKFAIFSEPLLIPPLLFTSLLLFMIGDAARPTMLAVTAGTSALFHFSLGSLGSMYSLMAVLYTCAMMLPIQMSAKDQKDQKVPMIHADRHAVQLVAVMIAAKCLVYGTFGVMVE